MTTVLRRPPQTCFDCLTRQRRYRSSLASAAVAATIINRSPQDDRLHLIAAHHAPSANHDDRILRQVFDSPSFWREFNQQETRGRSFRSPRSTGLFRNRYLTDPNGFGVFAQRSLRRCVKVVSKVEGISTVQGYKGIVRDLDTLSDLLCRVIDLCDFVRASHPDVAFQEAAAAAYLQMFEYMNVLNTTRSLHDQLKEALETPEVFQSWSEEEKATARILMLDFSKSAIDLPTEEKQKFVQLSSEIYRLGSAFVEGARPKQSFVFLKPGPSRKRRSSLARVFGRSKDVATLPVVGPEAIEVLRTVEQEEDRKKVYLAGRVSPQRQLSLLKELLQRRAEIAKLSGFESYARMTLADKMAKSPGMYHTSVLISVHRNESDGPGVESVDTFLHRLHQSNRGRAHAEYNQLLRLKRVERPQEGGDSSLNAWDREYYSCIHSSQTRQRMRPSVSLDQYLSLGTVMQGLSRLFSRLYGLRLVPREASIGETWNDDVRRLDVMDEQDGHIAVLYCDLFAREGKNPHPAHFTLRCSRQISEDELVEVVATTDQADQAKNAEEVVTDGMASTRTSTGHLYQLPTIALICDFARPQASSCPALLSLREMQTLFHEMGHALHSVLGRTAMQNVSGTRCATDFAELPSVLMEHFATDPDVLALFARHWQTDEPLPYEAVEVSLALDRLFEGAEIEGQLILAMVDQRYHSSMAAQADFDPSTIYHALQRLYATIPEPPQSTWQGMFAHLFGYGATYYAYLFDRAIAGKIWRDVFQRRSNHHDLPGNLLLQHGHDSRNDDRDGNGDGVGGEGNGGPLNPEAGHRFRQELLRWGGSRDGWTCIAAVLGDESLALGDESAMAKVGQWGVT